MENVCVSVYDFRKLEHKVNELLAAHESDKTLTKEEKELIKEAKEDLKNRKKESFTNIAEI